MPTPKEIMTSMLKQQVVLEVRVGTIYVNVEGLLNEQPRKGSNRYIVDTANFEGLVEFELDDVALVSVEGTTGNVIRLG